MRLDGSSFRRLGGSRRHVRCWIPT
jgi:hypothetical protein